MGFRPQSPPGPPTRVIGTTVAINKEADPLVMLNEQPLDPDVQTMDRVVITGSGWPSIDGRFFPVSLQSVPLSQFRLLGGNTSGETVGTGAGATAAVEA